MIFGNVLIFGDSYSTYKGHIPEGYSFYYPPSIPERPSLPDVNDTWWKSLINETESTLILNNSWSGSTMGYTGYDGADTSKTSSFITRLRKLTLEGFFEKNKIDTVFVFGGTNDSWSNAPVGELKYENRTESDLYFVLPGICEFLEALKLVLPKANIIVLINEGLKAEITEGLRLAATHYDMTPIKLSGIDKKSDHPTVAGMKSIKEQILKNLS